MPTPIVEPSDFALKLKRPPGEEFARLLRSQLEGARAQLARAGAEAHDGIHQGRRALRRARAVLLLMRPSLEVARYDALLEPLREAGRLLSPLRDAQSVLEALDRHHAEIERAGLAADVALLRPRLIRRRNAIVARRAAARELARRCIAGVLAEVDRGFDGLDRTALWAGLEFGLRRTRKAMRDAQAEPREENVHRLRQRARALWLMLALVAPLWPEVVGAQSGEARRISQLLGAERDLVLLQRALDPSGAAASSALASLDALSCAERQRLRRKAFRIGALLCAEPPSAAVARLKAYRGARQGRGGPTPAPAAPR